MNNNTQFLIRCSNCQKQQPHFVIKVSLKRGFKLACSKCGKLKKQYYKRQFLHEYHPINQIEEELTPQPSIDDSTQSITNTQTKLKEEKHEKIN